ncbi:hypothetical protein BESB_031300 [Besnoitia besnoiti]|uniref:Transmembrane protein n=1 Tax=Besnoitia besnoiti TaxID=94643 RepID=A0A2A9M5U5_BESBE|nr:hypothetical protein BESB_031300 [Besnoitia besnoiti]PFH31256.1 hypothetical protein BESB_031300 [Besnoitia besnoiti]
MKTSITPLPIVEDMVIFPCRSGEPRSLEDGPPLADGQPPVAVTESGADTQVFGEVCVRLFPQVKSDRDKCRLLAATLACVVMSTLCFCCLTAYVIWSCSYQSPFLGLRQHSTDGDSRVGPFSAVPLSQTNSSQTASFSAGAREVGNLYPGTVLPSDLVPLDTVPPPFVSIWDINAIPLFAVQNMGTLALRWGEVGQQNTTEIVLQVTGISRSTANPGSTDGPTDSTTTVLLSGGFSFVVGEETAALYDSSGNTVKSMTKVVRPDSPLQGEGGRELPEASDSPHRYLGVRRLEPKPGGLFGMPKQTGFAPAVLPNGPPPQPIGPPASFMDAYCRYGCGGMSVTFPYYYRPFFGYGYPLVGTEAMFPQGYGGYAAAPLLASQGGAPVITGASGPVLAGGVPAAVGAPGFGAANVVGGIRPVAVALPV